MAAKMRRHSVAVMSTSYLTQSVMSPSSLSHRTTTSNGGIKAPPSESPDRKSMTGNSRALSSKAIDRGTPRDGSAKTPPSITSSPSSAASAVRARRHSVAVHPGAVLSVMESGRQATSAAESKKMPMKPTASDVIDDLIRLADAALIRVCPLPTGSALLQAAIQEPIQELDESTDDMP